MSTAFASIGDRLLTLLAPKAVASAGGCEYERWCKVQKCGPPGQVFPRTLIITYSNCDSVVSGCCT
jgi:hypothetical protein